MPGLKIKNIRTNGFLSFESVKFKDFDKNINFIVGANGSGKTNFAKLIVFLKKVSLNPWNFPYLINIENYLKKRTHKIKIEADIELILSDEEMEMLVIATAMVFFKQNNKIIPSESDNHKISLRNSIKFFNYLWKKIFKEGSLIIEYDNIKKDHKIFYKSLRKNNIVLDIVENLLVTDYKEDNYSKNTNAFFYTADEKKENIIQSINNIANSLNNNERNYIDKFNLWSDEDVKYSMLTENFISFGRENEVEVKSLDIQRAIKYAEKYFIKDIQLGLSNGTNRVSISTIFMWILENSIVNLDGFRYSSNNNITIKDVENTQNFDGTNLYQFLLKLKIYQPKNYAEIKKSFTELSGGKDFDIKIDNIDDFQTKTKISPLSVFQSQELNIPSEISLNQTSVNVYVKDHKCELGLYFKDNTDFIEEFSFEFSPAGYYEMLMLSTAIAGLENKIIILDEPAQNLHPAFQHKLLNNILGEDKNQFFIITHSPDLVEIDKKDIKGNIFIFRNKNTNTEISRFEPKNLDKIQLFKYEELKRLFFAKGVILVEGFSEEILAKRLIRNNVFFERIKGKGDAKFKNEVNTGDIEVVNIEGIGSLVNYIKLIEKLGLHYVAIIDSDIFDDDLKKMKDNKNIIDSITELLKIKNVKPSFVKITLKNKYPVFYQESENSQKFERYVEEEFKDKFKKKYLTWCKEKFGSNDEECLSRKKINYPLYLTETKELFDDIISGKKLKIYSEAVKCLFKQIKK